MPGGWGEARLQKLTLGVGPGKCATLVAFTAEPGLIDCKHPSCKGGSGSLRGNGPSYSVVGRRAGPGYRGAGRVGDGSRAQGAGGLISPELVITITSEKQSGKSCPIAVAPTQGTGLSAPTQGARIYDKRQAPV